MALFADETLFFSALDENLPELFFVIVAQLPRLPILFLPVIDLLYVLLDHTF